MKLTSRCLKEIKDVEEGVIAEPEYKGKKVRALLRIDVTDEKNLSQHDQSESDEYFYMRNKHDVPSLKKIDVKINTDSDEVHEAVRRRLNQRCCE